MSAAAVQLASDLAEADAAIERAVLGIDQFSRMNRREAAAIAYATGGRLPAPRRGAGVVAGDSAAEAAGAVLEPAFEALAEHGRRLAALTGPVPPGPPPPQPAVLRRQAEEGLARYEALLRRSDLTPAAREAGLAAIATLASAPAAGTEFSAFITERQAAVEALASLLRAVIGADERSGLRAVLAAEQAEARRGRDALLAAARRDPAAGVLGRYALFHGVMRAEEEQPADEVLAEAVRVLAALPAAHAALAEGDPAAAAQRVAAFSAAVDRLEAAERELARAAY
ncbi:hypothetical protein [Caldovatus aquaticus]|uniref:Uncharacterized protein n=1 Tax=Caldovatus aquaticus TaxID=2865671 RepID=A0ABS7F7J0_9PROT|nr:hypothetical protein [Caldovatus aquaticus]MBW8271429.1 hypothetical protein [Caldovatus aquaticus]